jgi:hypothetical protein
MGWISRNPGCFDRPSMGEGQRDLEHVAGMLAIYFERLFLATKRKGAAFGWGTILFYFNSPEIVLY